MNEKRNREIKELKNALTNILMCYNKLTTEGAEANRISDDIILYKNQLSDDMVLLNSIRNNALTIFDQCNQLLMSR